MPLIQPISSARHNELILNYIADKDTVIPENSVGYIATDNTKLCFISKKRFNVYRVVTTVDKVIPFLRLAALFIKKARNIIQTVKDIENTSFCIKKIKLKNKDNKITELKDHLNKKDITNKYATSECFKYIHQNYSLLIVESLANNTSNNVLLGTTNTDDDNNEFNKTKQQADLDIEKNLAPANIIKKVLTENSEDTNKNVANPQPSEITHDFSGTNLQNKQDNILDPKIKSNNQLTNALYTDSISSNPNTNKHKIYLENMIFAIENYTSEQIASFFDMSEPQLYSIRHSKELYPLIVSIINKIVDPTEELKQQLSEEILKDAKTKLTTMFVANLNKLTPSQFKRTYPWFGDTLFPALILKINNQGPVNYKMLSLITIQQLANIKDNILTKQGKYEIILSKFQYLTNVDADCVYDFFNIDIVLQSLNNEDILKEFRKSLNSKLKNKDTLRKSLKLKLIKDTKYLNNSEYCKWFKGTQLLEDFLLENVKQGNNINVFLSELTLEDINSFKPDTLKQLCKNISADNTNRFKEIFTQSDVTKITKYFPAMINLTYAGFGDISNVIKNHSFLSHMQELKDDNFYEILFKTQVPAKIKEKVEKSLSTVANYLAISLLRLGEDINRFTKLIKYGKCYINPNIIDQYGIPFLTMTIDRPIEFLKLWIANFKDKGLDFNLTTQIEKHPPLMHTILQKNNVAAQLLCDSCDQIQVFNVKDYDKSPVVLSLTKDNHEIWKTLINFLARTKKYEINDTKNLLNRVFFGDKHNYLTNIIDKLETKIDNDTLKCAVKNAAPKCLTKLLQVQNDYDLIQLLEYANNLFIQYKNNSKTDKITGIKTCIDIIKQKIDN